MRGLVAGPPRQCGQLSSGSHRCRPFVIRIVFSDAWAILRTAIDEGMSSGLREQVLTLYLSVVEPFFSLPVRTEELAKVKVRPQGDEPPMR